MKPHLAAHQFHETCGNGKTEARAAKFARCRTIRLRKSLEDLLMLFRWNANAGVQHRETNGNFVARRIQPKGFHADMPFFCEFDSVSREVDQDLAQPRGVAANELRKFFLNRPGKLKTAL